MRVTQSSGPIQSLFSYYFILFFPEAADTGSNYSGNFSVLWISTDCAMEGPVLISHQTPLHSNAFQALLN